MKKILSIWLLISIFSISGDTIAKVKSCMADVVNTVGKGSYTCLVYGFDSSSGNTDTIIALNYNAVENSISFIHIPRDSYFNFGTAQNKINQIVPTCINAGNDKKDGLNTLTKELSESLGIDIDGYTALTEEAVANLVDMIGGININVPCDIEGTDIDGNKVEIKRGEQHLSGKECLVLIRHRSTYPLGDLSRIDMQKVFLSAFVKDLFENINASLAIKLFTTKDEGITTNVNIVEFLSFFIKNLGRIKNASVKFATLPGEAVISDSGVSYFGINKKASVALLSELGFLRPSGFDPCGKFLYDSGRFKEIYFSENIKYRIYTSDELKSLRIITN